MEENKKTIKLSAETWKALMQMKLDKGKTSIDDVIIEMIDKEGY